MVSVSIIYVDENLSDNAYERKLPNDFYRYDGYYKTIHFCIDSPVKKTESEIFEFLDSRSIDFSD